MSLKPYLNSGVPIPPNILLFHANLRAQQNAPWGDSVERAKVLVTAPYERELTTPAVEAVSGVWDATF